MNHFSTLTVLLLSCWLCAGKLFAASPEVEKARQHGAQGQVTLRVTDSTGKPVEKAQMSVAFFPSDSSADFVVSEGQTDTNGLFMAAGKTIHSMNYEIKKERYYTTTGKYWFLRQGEDCVQKGRWQPWNPTNTVVLKEHRKPVPMYAKNVDMPVPIRDAPAGFDLEVGDWVAPHGKGKESDLLFTYKAKVQDYWNGSLELTIACTNKLDGVYRTQKDIGSELHSAYEAPSAAYKPEVHFVFVTTTDRDLKVEKMGEAEYLIFRVRTVVGDKGDIVSARYGKIYGPIEFGVGKGHHVRFSYCFNPDGTQNLEFDPKRNLIANPGSMRGYMP